MNNSSSLKLILSFVLALSATTVIRADESARAPKPLCLDDLPKFASPTGLVEVVRNEIRWEQHQLRRQVADVRAGKPQALIELTFTGARLAGADAGIVTGTKLAYHIITLDSKARNERLDTALPRVVAQAPDRGFRKVVHAAVRGAVTGNWDVPGAITNDLTGQMIELVPATFNSARDTAREINPLQEAPRS